MIRYRIVEISDNVNDIICTLVFDDGVDRQTIETYVTDIFAEGFFGTDETVSTDYFLSDNTVNVVDINTEDTRDMTPTEIKCHVLLIEDDNNMTLPQDEFLSARVDNESALFYKKVLGDTIHVVEEYDFITSSLNLGNEFN